MTTIDVHPDDLLEREMAGTLSTADERRLATHVARCASCRLERQLRADFDRELSLQTAPVMLQTLVSGALRAARAPDASDPTEPETRQALPARRSRRRIAVLLASGLALSAGLAAARPDLAGRAIDFVSDRVMGLGALSPPRRADSPAAAPRGVSPVPPPVATDVAATSEPAEHASAVPADRAGWVRPVPSTEAVRSSTSLRSAGAPRPELSDQGKAGRTAPAHDPGSVRLEPSVMDVDPEPLRGQESDASAAILFDRANAARVRGPGGDGLYRELQAHFPESPEARLSFAILGRKQLDTGDAESALASFEAYLSTGDRALREQSMAGRALACGRLGEHERERQSWLALLGAYPRSAYAGLARQRLAQDGR